jgi:hypothetical protein
VNFFRRVLNLCSGFAGYRDVLDVTPGAALRYLAQLLTLLVVAFVVASVPWVRSRGEDVARWYDQHGPAFRLQDGKVVTDIPQPFQAGDAKFQVRLDTTGQVQTSALTAAQGVLIAADSLSIWVRPAANTNQILLSSGHRLQGLPDGKVDGHYLRELLRILLWVGVPMAVVGMLLVSFVGVLLQAWLFTLAASFMERNAPGALEFRQLLNLALHAVTPGAIILTVYAACRLEGIDLWLVYLIAYGIFLVGATNACHRPAVPQESRDEDPF